MIIKNLCLLLFCCFITSAVFAQDVKIGLVSAMQEELGPFPSLMSHKKEIDIGICKFVEGEIGNHKVVLGISGCGKVAAANTISILIYVFRVNSIIFIGTAGSADSTLNPGDIVIANGLVQLDMDESAFNWHKKFEIPSLGIIRFKPDYALSALAKKTTIAFLKEDFDKDKILARASQELKLKKPKVIFGLVGTEDQFINDKAKIDALKRELPDLKCVEMEGAAVAQICYYNKTPFLVIRVISDNADENAQKNALSFTKEFAPNLICGLAQKVIKAL